MRISDWSSDVCSSDLGPASAEHRRCGRQGGRQEDPGRGAGSSVVHSRESGGSDLLVQSSAVGRRWPAAGRETIPVAPRRWRTGSPRGWAFWPTSPGRHYAGPKRPTFLLGGSHMAGSVILAGARTPIGKLSGALAGFSAAELGGLAIKAALERAGLSAEQVEYVFMGQVLRSEEHTSELQ